MPTTVKLSRRDERMCSKRARSEPLEEPVYDIEVVRNVQEESILRDCCLVRVTDRDVWKRQLTELLACCNEAAWRSSQRQKARRRDMPPPAAPFEAKPLVLEYLLDRIDTDDPLCGYQLRTRKEGWLQGFVTFTAFTTWQTYFRWDSLDRRNGITLDDLDCHAVDEDGDLARMLDEYERSGDPDGCGVIWPRIAEVTLLGGLGCGGHLLQLALDHLASEGRYDAVVLQVPRAGTRQVHAVVNSGKERAPVPPPHPRRPRTMLSPSTRSMALSVSAPWLSIASTAASRRAGTPGPAPAEPRPSPPASAPSRSPRKPPSTSPTRRPSSSPPLPPRPWAHHRRWS